jgi:hypothetical protein
MKRTWILLVLLVVIITFNQLPLVAQAIHAKSSAGWSGIPACTILRTMSLSVKRAGGRIGDFSLITLQLREGPNQSEQTVSLLPLPSIRALIPTTTASHCFSRMDSRQKTS